MFGEDADYSDVSKDRDSDLTVSATDLIILLNDGKLMVIVAESKLGLSWDIAEIKYRFIQKIITLDV